MDIDLYGEVVENEQELEIEAKIILQKRFGNLGLAANLVAEHDFLYASREQDTVLDPSLGITYEVTPVFQPGIDSWMWSRDLRMWPRAAPPRSTMANIYVGPAVLFQLRQVLVVHGRLSADHELRAHDATRRGFVRAALVSDDRRVELLTVGGRARLLPRPVARRGLRQGQPFFGMTGR